MFRRAAIKISAIFVVIAMLMSVVISVVVYGEALLDQPYKAASANTLTSLILLNFILLVVVGAVSYIVSRRVLGKLEQMYVSMSQFTGRVSHSIRTPLANMLLDTEVTLSNEKVTVEELKDQLSRNLDEIDRLKSLCKSLSQISSTDPVNLEYGNVDLTDITKISMLRYDPEQKRIKMHVPSKPIIVRVNESSIVEAISIILNSVYAYSIEDSEIEIILKRNRKTATLSITGKGSLIPSGRNNDIFDPLYRADEAHGGEGAGLGMSLAKQIVYLHDGRISARSHDVNINEFKIELPLKNKRK